MTFRSRFFLAVSVAVLASWALFFAAPVLAGALSWSQEKISSPIGQFGVPVSSYFSPPASVPNPALVPGLGSKITRVQVTWGHQARLPLQAKLCWSDMALCVPVTGSSTTTNAFNGRDARGPLVLVYTAVGKGRVPQPVFVRASVSVWFLR